MRLPRWNASNVIAFVIVFAIGAVRGKSVWESVFAGLFAAFVVDVAATVRSRQ